MRVPDLGVTNTPYETEQAALPEPVLVVEILSPSNQAKTWTNVLAYTSILSLQEMLVLRSDRSAAELLRRLPRVSGGELVLDAIGFRVPLAEVYAGTRLAGRD